MRTDYVSADQQAGLPRTQAARERPTDRKADLEAMLLEPGGQRRAPPKSTTFVGRLARLFERAEARSVEGARWLVATVVNGLALCACAHGTVHPDLVRELRDGGAHGAGRRQDRS